ncbi:hypothetical protein NDU88_002347 [Pleurodeles waltl]|uniref:Uncharacterized protein n=1 Tax=Pleurodeles waltl TaxID=8319 RepID=A0AAV7RFI4_PLEWA|nr:hypothetical protein NDU88_002347 [Pleurodeles waltl]
MASPLGYSVRPAVSKPFIARSRFCPPAHATRSGSFQPLIGARETGLLWYGRRPPGAPRYACCSIGLKLRPHVDLIKVKK